MKIVTDLTQATLSNVSDYAAAEGLGFDQACEKLLSLAITFTRLEEGGSPDPLMGDYLEKFQGVHS